DLCRSQGLTIRNISPTIIDDKEIAGAVALRLHHLRWHVRCRPTGVDGLDECPRSSASMSGPGRACPNKTPNLTFYFNYVQGYYLKLESLRFNVFTIFKLWSRGGTVTL